MIFRRLLYSFAFTFTWLVPLRAAYWVADILGTLQYCFDTRARKAVLKNMEIICPDRSLSEQKKIARKTFLNFSRALAEVFRMHRKGTNFLSKSSNLELFDFLNEDHTNGLIIATAHFCNWELSAAAVTAFIPELNSIALPDPDPVIDTYYIRARKAIKNNTVPLENASISCLKLLKEGQALAILSDRTYTGEGIECDFFGKKTLFPTGAAQFAVKQGIPIHPLFVIRTGIAEFKALRYDPIDVPEDGTRKEKTEQMIKAFVKVLEKLISEYPEFWFSFYSFWEGTPPGGKIQPEEKQELQEAAQG